MSPTIYDIARQAGVSSSTVARVLRGDSRGGRRDSAERAARIREIATQLGYRPNVRARAFARGRTKGVGLLYTEDGWIFEGMNDVVVRGLVRELRKHEHHLLVVPVDKGGDWEEAVLGGHVDATVTFQALPPEVHAQLATANLPCVVLGDNALPGLPHVLVDDVAGAYSAARHLLTLGHQRIGLFVHQSVKPHCSIALRREGYAAALQEAGLSHLFWHCGEEEMVEVLTRSADRPTAIICYSDLESTLIAHAMWQYGVRIPADFSLIGFNDKFATRYMTPPLTTVAFDAERIGEVGAQLLIASLAGTDGATTSDAECPNNSSPNQPRDAMCHKIHTRLIVRGSTAPP